MKVVVCGADEVDMVACQGCHSLFNVPTKIARVGDQSYLKPMWSGLFSRGHLPIDVIISPEIEVARAVRRRKLKTLGIGDGERLPKGGEGEPGLDHSHEEAWK